MKFLPPRSSCQPLNWVKTCNSELLLPQNIDGHKHNKGYTFMTNIESCLATLERTWDTQHDFVNPYTCQLININDLIPHSKPR